MPETQPTGDFRPIPLWPMQQAALDAAQGAYRATYHIDFAAPVPAVGGHSFVPSVAAGGQIPPPPITVNTGDYVMMPSFSVNANPTFTFSDIATRRFDIVDRNLVSARNAIAQEEDGYIYTSILNSGNAQEVSGVTRRELLQNGYMGDIWNASLHVSPRVAGENHNRPIPPMEPIELISDGHPGDGTRWDEI